MNHHDLISSLPLTLGRALRRMSRTTRTYPPADYTMSEWRQTLLSNGNYLLAYGWRQRHGLDVTHQQTINAKHALAWCSIMLPSLWS